MSCQPQSMIHCCCSSTKISVNRSGNNWKVICMLQWIQTGGEFLLIWSCLSSRNLSFLNICHNLVKNKMIICTYVDTFWVYWSVKTFWSHILCDLSVWVATERYAPCAITQFCFARYKLKHFNLRRVCKVATEIVQFVYKISQHFFPLTLPVFCKHFYFKYHHKDTLS